MSIDENCKSLQLISLHIPKTGGSALMLWLQRVYGKDMVYLDNDQNPHNQGQPYHKDAEAYLANFTSGYPFLVGKKVVHGHLWMKKYKNISNVPRITFLRDPIQRLISDYWNEKIFSEGYKTGIFEYIEPIDILARKYRAWNRKWRIRHNPRQLSFFKTKPTLIQFASSPIKRHFYTKTFFPDYGPEYYDFIGDHANFDAEMDRLMFFLGIADDQKLIKENLTSTKAQGYQQFKQSILTDTVTLGKLKTLLADDIGFYEKYAGK